MVKSRIAGACFPTPTPKVASSSGSSTTRTSLDRTFQRLPVPCLNLGALVFEPMNPTINADQDRVPLRQHWVLIALIAVASVANLNLAVANVALPSIGIAFQASQLQLTIVSIGFSVGLASTVLYLGGIGDRYGRKTMLILGMALTIPTSLLAAWAPSVEILILARILGGVAAGMAFPTTLSLITALWTGHGRTRSIALWSAIGGSMIAVASLLSGWLLGVAWWGLVFAITAPLAAISLLLAWIVVPAHVNETKDKVDHLGGILSLLGILSLTLAIDFVADPAERRASIIAGAIAIISLLGFFIAQRRVANPLFDLAYAKRRTFWVAAAAGLIVFGSLMGVTYVSQQFMQNVLGYSPLKAGATIVPAALSMILTAPLSAKLISRYGSRITLLIGYVFLFFALLVSLVSWNANASIWVVELSIVLMGAGVGFAGTPASHSLTGSVPVHRAGMASGTADLQRDLGGSVMQSLLGTILTAGYAVSIANQAAAAKQPVPTNVVAEIQRSFSGAEIIAKQYPTHANQIIEAAKSSFMDGSHWAYAAGLIAIVVGAIVVAIFFPGKTAEQSQFKQYQSED